MSASSGEPAGPSVEQQMEILAARILAGKLLAEAQRHTQSPAVTVLGLANALGCLIPYAAQSGGDQQLLASLTQVTARVMVLARMERTLGEAGICAVPAGHA